MPRFDGARRARERQVVIGKVRYGGVAGFTRATEDPMTEDRMALVELLQKSGEAACGHDALIPSSSLLHGLRIRLTLPS
jgi:hypothetical protein